MRECIGVCRIVWKKVARGGSRRETERGEKGEKNEECKERLVVKDEMKLN